MAEKKRISGEKRTNSAGRVALTPTRSSPRNKINVANNSQVNDETVMAKNKKLVQTKLNFIRTTRKQNTTEETPPVEEVTLLETPKKRGRKPGTKKQENKPDDNSGQENGHDDVPNGRKRQKKNKINGADDNVLWIKSEFTMPMRASRGLAKRAGKEADCPTEEQGESPASPLLTYPGDLKCEACQRTFSNSSGFKRHLKFCLDAEGPPVVMKLKKPQAQVVSAAVVNGAIPKSVIDPEKKLATREKEGKGKAGRGRTDQSPQPERATRNETEPSKKVTKKTPAREKRAEESSNADKKKDVAAEVGGKEAGKATRGRPPNKKSDEDQKKRVGRRSEGGKAAEGEEKKMDDGDVVKEKSTRGGRRIDAAKEMARYTDQEDEDLDDSYIDERDDDDDDDDDMNDVFDNSVSLSDIEDMEAEEGEPQLGIGAEKSLREKMKGVMLSKVNELIDETSATAPGKCHCCGEDLETAHLGGEFECDDCGKHFKLRASLDRHRRVIHLQGETHACPECDARCPDKGSLARHMYTHTGLKPYSCVRCKKQFSRKYHLERHIVQTGCDGNPKPTYPCQVCGRMFSRKDNLREHLRAHAGQVKRKKKYSCEYCLKEFHGTSLLRIHVRTHTGERPFVCDFCQKGFPSSGAMKKHRRMHTGERPYECKDCFAKFSAKETLNRHARTHTGLKPHVCNYCGKSFIQASQLRAHVFHHTGENGFTCDHCGKAFNRRARLHMHVKYVHEGARPFECSNCGKTFVRKEDLVRHTVLHSGVKAHKCPICEKSFAMKSSLKIHLLTHTKEPPRSCDECGRAFIRQDCLLRHMRSKHREMLEEILAEAEKKKLQQQLLAATATAAMASRMVVRGERARVSWGASRETHPDDDLEEEDDDMDDVPETGAIDRVLGMSGSESAKAGALLQHLTAMGEAAGANPIPRMDTAASAVLNSLGTSIPSGAHHHQSSNMVQGGGLSETALADSVKELLTLLVDDATLRAFGWPDAPVDKLLEAVIRRCGHQPASPEDYSRPSDRLRENAKLLFTVVIDDSAVKTLLNNQTVDEVILHVLRLAKS